MTADEKETISDRPMQIAQIVPSLEARYGGPSKSVYELARAMAATGHAVDLIATDPSQDSFSQEGSLAVRMFRRGWPPSLCPSAGLRRYLRQSEASVIHHHALWLRTLHYARAAAARRGVPLVVSPRGMMSRWAWHHHGGRKRLAHFLVHPGALAAVSGWHATSGAEAAEIRDRGFKQPICVAPNGIAAPDPAATETAIARWRKLCPEAAERPVALFYSRFHRKKRVLELIDLWSERGPRDWLLLMVGIPEEFTVEMLEDYALRAAGARRVRVFSGAGDPPPYAISSLFLLPSHNENFGLSIAEALAHGVPAIVTDSTPWERLNQEGGWCVPWDRYADALDAAVAAGPERLRERGARARAWVLREYSWERPARALIEFYRCLAAGAS